MSRLAIKICGLSTPRALDAAMRHGASHVGFVLFPKSPRNIDAEQVGALARRVREGVTRVAVMVDPEDAQIEQLLRMAPIDVIQLHGEETPSRVADLRQRFKINLWKAIPVKTRLDLAVGAGYVGVADMLLYDAKTPDDAALPGGMGLRFDWGLLSGFRSPLPWGLSGGLDPSNVARAVAQTRTPLVDVSSGVESAPGIKDVDKIAAFCKAVSAC